MSYEEDHPLIAKYKKYNDTGETRQDMYQRISHEVAYFAPEAREAFLREIDAAIEGDESNVDDQGNPKPTGSLRQRAQLLNLHRVVEDSHRKLKIAGR